MNISLTLELFYYFIFVGGAVFITMILYGFIDRILDLCSAIWWAIIDAI